MLYKTQCSKKMRAPIGIFFLCIILGSIGTTVTNMWFISKVTEFNRSIADKDIDRVEILLGNVLVTKGPRKIEEMTKSQYMEHLVAGDINTEKDFVQYDEGASLGFLQMKVAVTIELPDIKVNDSVVKRKSKHNYIFRFENWAWKIVEIEAYPILKE